MIHDDLAIENGDFLPTNLGLQPVNCLTRSKSIFPKLTDPVGVQKTVCIGIL
jgi:hypothetical protein